jgi:predicted ATPase
MKEKIVLIGGGIFKEVSDDQEPIFLSAIEIEMNEPENSTATHQRINAIDIKVFDEIIKNNNEELEYIGSPQLLNFKFFEEKLLNKFDKSIVDLLKDEIKLIDSKNITPFEIVENIKALHTKEMKKFFKSSEEDILAYDYENDKDNNIKISLLVDKDENIYNFLDKYFLDKEIELLINKEFLFEEAKKLEFLMEEKDIEIFFYLNRIGFLDCDFFDGKKSFSSLSSGEKSFFSDTVILSKEIKDFLKYKDDKNSLILILDEPETTFHPQWQKKYIDYLISLINKNFTGNAHIILTSHSPFIHQLKGHEMHQP